MKKVVTLCLATLFLVCAADFSDASAAACQYWCSTGGVASRNDEGFLAQGRRWSNPSEVGSATGMAPPAMQYDYRPVFIAGSVCDKVCEQKAAAVLAACLHQSWVVWVAQRPSPSGTWTVQSAPECLSPAEQLTFDPAQLQAMVDDYFQRIPLPEPGLHVAPADNAVVNLPEIVAADPPGQTTFTVNVAPFPTVTISAKVQWQWDFGDGGQLSTGSPGRAYDSHDPDPSHYLTHTYSTASKGWPLSVTSVWTATYTVAGMPGTQAVNGAVRRTSARALPAAEYGSVLTGN